MWTVVNVPGDDVLGEVLDLWKAGIDAERPQQVAEVFAEDAVFQGLSPYSLGRLGVSDYYASRPRGTTVTYSILESRRPAADVVHGYVQVDFAYPDRPTLRLHLVALPQTDHGHQQRQRNTHPSAELNLVLGESRNDLAFE
jgi:hypothetical protein